MTAAKRSEERLLTDAVYDRVTGLPNRALFLDRLSRALAGLDGRAVHAIYVLLIDLDRFKLVNDALGYEVETASWPPIGRRLTEMADPYDSAGAAARQPVRHSLR